MKDGTDQYDGQRDTSRQRVWMAGVWACPAGEGKHVGRWREGVARGLSRGESDPVRSGFCWFCSMWSFSSSRRMPSWNISASSSLEGETPLWALGTAAASGMSGNQEASARVPLCHQQAMGPGVNPSLLWPQFTHSPTRGYSSHL